MGVNMNGYEYARKLYELARRTEKENNPSATEEELNCAIALFIINALVKVNAPQLYYPAQ